MNSQDNPKRPVVIVFAKMPAPFVVKTRLIPRVGAVTASNLHRAFVLDTLSGLAELNGLCDVELHTDRVGDGWPEFNSALKLQVPGDLGTKMLAALESALGEGRPVAAILGSDSPTLPSSYVAAMLECPNDVCFGPAHDGGFYAIACRRTAPTMFEGVTWSSSDTLEQTVRAVQQSDLTFSLGEKWYDIDSGEDLARLIADPDLRSFTSNALKEEGLMLVEDSNPPVAGQKEASHNESA
jgi:uncharacterized protein